MSESKIYVDDIGTEVIADTKSDISAQTKVSLKVMKPSDTVEEEWVGSTVVETLQEYVDDTDAELTDDEFEGMDPSDPVERRITYTIIATNWNEAGTFKIQGYAEMPTWTGRGETFDVIVYSHFE